MTLSEVTWRSIFRHSPAVPRRVTPDRVIAFFRRNLPCGDAVPPGEVKLFDNMSLAVGARLGPYEILASIGAGGVGDVYRAREVRLGREVAVKVLPESRVRESEALRRFEQEAFDFAGQHAGHKIGTTQRSAACRHCTQWGIRSVRGGLSQRSGCNVKTLFVKTRAVHRAALARYFRIRRCKILALK